MALEVVRRLVGQVWNGGQLDLLPELFTDPFDHGGRQDTVAGLRQWHIDEALTWANSRYEIVDEVAGGDRVALRWQATARQVGPWGPVAPTGREVTWAGVHFFTVQAGRITGMWAMGDVFGKAMQLGAQIVPPNG
ncbi:hypothetical protein Rhe02_26530 [Rhizocola hellebori]|uniref:Ester cyclase n=1 Tax=Rhizocola hellebori TaxID=1392758 RepID=A0A8J3VFZ7_9ACTN|nr:ester cyclase [Rhizocola hellebori]GIH04586.1 hypothetical protein Rhe02_26530 [Rhizocola hellebori]